MAEEDASSKTEEPTGKRLEDAKQKGQVPYTKELGSTIGLFGIFTVMYWMGTWLFGSMRGFYEGIFLNLRPWRYDGLPILDRIFSYSGDTLTVILIVLLVGFFMPLLGHILQKGIKPSPEAAMPSLDKINPVSGVKKLFSFETFTTFGKNVIKAAGLMGIYYIAVRPHVTEIAFSAQKPYESALAFYGSIIFRYLVFALIFLIVVILADYLINRMQHFKKLRMSRQEIKDEQKETEGSPEIKGKVREIQRERSRRQIDKKVPESTVIITNPTHFAVALRYEQGKVPIPMLTAKGVDALSKRIRDLGRKNNVPIVANPPLARAIYRDVKVGQPIPRKFYKSVAKILATIFRLEEEKKQRLAEIKKNQYNRGPQLF